MEGSVTCASLYERARDALEPEDCARAVLEATRTPELFHYGELLDLESVQRLRGTEHANVLEVLQVFAYGTWKDVPTNQSVALDDLQKRKLKQLTFLSLAEQERTLNYADLMKILEIKDVRSLEDFLINDCIYSGIAQGILDQKGATFEVTGAVSRDMKPEGLGALIGALEDWLTTIDDVIQDVHDGKNLISAERSRIAAEEEIFMAQIDQVRAELMAAEDQMEGVEGNLMSGADYGGGFPAEPTTSSRSKRRR